MAAPDEYNYDKRLGTGGMHGQKYEVKMACLMYLRAVRSCRNFYMAANLNKAGAFDDVVLRLYGGSAPSRTFFLQLKHKLNKKELPRTMFLSILKMNDFSLLKYFLSFRDEILPEFQSQKYHHVFGSPLEECSLVLYTNAHIQGECQDSHYQDKWLSSNPEGCVFSFHKDRDSDMFEFAEHLKLYHDFLKQLLTKIKDFKDVADIIQHEAAMFMTDYETKYLCAEHKGTHNIWEMVNILKQNPSTNKLIEHINKLAAFGDLSGYVSFIENLTLCTGQASETELDSILLKELIDALSLPKNKTGNLLRNFCDKIQTWWEGGQGLYLRKNSVLWDEMFHQALNMINAQKISKIEDLDIIFRESEIDCLRKSMDDAQVVLCLAMGESTMLTMCKVVQMLKMQPFILGESDEAILFWKQQKKCQLLVLEGSNMAAEQLLTLSDVLKCHLDKKLIVISLESDLKTVGILKSLVKEGCGDVRDYVTLASLDKASQERLLHTVIQFQGHDILLAELVQDEQVLMEALTADLVFSLLKGESLQLGAKLDSKVTHYIPQTLNRADILLPHLVKDLLHIEGFIFIVSCTSKEEIEALVPLGEQVCDFEDHISAESRFYVVENERYITPVEIENENYIFLIKKDNVFKIISWRGDIDISRFIDHSKKSTWQSKDAWDVPGRMLIIAAEPGMGKSTLISHVAVETKFKKPSTWVVKVNLNQMTNYLDGIQGTAITEDQTIHFLEKAADITGHFETLLFRHSMMNTERTVVLIDGFDEICPDYKEDMMFILKSLLKTKIGKLWVTTRLNIKQRLEQSLCSVAFMIKMFSLGDQRIFLTKVWRERIPGLDMVYLNSFISDVLHLLNGSLKGTGKSFIGIPLQTMLVADVFQEHLTNAKREESLPRNMDIVQLYEAFFQRKCEVYFVQKRGEDITKPTVRRGINREKLCIEEKHTRVALLLYLTANDIEMLCNASVLSTDKLQLEDIACDLQDIGIIQRVGGSNPEFLHRTITEFFVAKWLLKEFSNNIKFLKSKLLTDDYSFVRILLSIMLAQSFPLHCATLNSDFHAVEQSLKEHAINCRDRGGRTPLHLAVTTDIQDVSNRECVKLFLRHGADIDLTDNVLQISSVQYADLSGNWDALGIIMQEQKITQELTFIKSNTTSALLTACSGGYLELLQYLLEADVDVNAILDQYPYSRSALHVATEHGHVDLICQLLGAGANKNLKNGKGKTALHLASENGGGGIVMILLQYGADINVLDNSKSTCLHAAAEYGHGDIVNQLMQVGADINVRDSTGSTALHKALIGGFISIGEQLLLARANVNNTNSQGKTPLHLAAEHGHISLIECLIQAGVYINAVDIGRHTALHLAIENGHISIVDHLIKAGADIDEMKKYNYEALNLAADSGCLSDVKYLLQAGANINAVNQDGSTALHFASKNGHVAIVECLLEAGVDVNTVDEANHTALHFASKHGHFEVVKLLLYAKSDVNAINKSKRTALHLAIWGKHVSIVKQLIHAKADINAVDYQNKTPLHLAAWKGPICIVKLLLEAGANVSSVYKSGTFAFELAWDPNVQECLLHAAINDNSVEGYIENALGVAAKEGFLSVLERLLDAGANVNAVCNNNETALHLAARSGHVAVLECLIKAGANVHSLGSRNRTALYEAAEEGFVCSLEFLIQAGASVNVVDVFGESALHSAAYGGHVQAVECLIQAGADVNARDKNNDVPLQVAAKNGFVSVAECLIQGHATLATENNLISTVKRLHHVVAEVNAVPGYKTTALHLAIGSGHNEAVEYLIAAGADVNAMDGDNSTALHLATEKGNLDAVKQLVRSGADINLVDYKEFTAIDIANMCENRSMIEYLLQAGSNIKVDGPVNDTSLHVSAELGYNNSMEILLQAGADVNSIDHFRNKPLHVAAQQGNTILTERLLQAGADVDASNGNKNTALHLAAQKGHFDVVQLLIQAGCNISAVGGYNGKTALDLAIENNHEDVVSLLRLVSSATGYDELETETQHHVQDIPSSIPGDHKLH